MAAPGQEAAGQGAGLGGGAGVPPFQPPVIPIAQLGGLADRENMKIPIYYGEPALDSFQAEDWILRLQRLQDTYAWTERNLLNNAINALRGKALQFCTFMESYAEGSTTRNWSLFKQEFLKSFGRRARDTSGVANLNVKQQSNEAVQFFGHRVVIVTNEFFAGMEPPEDFDYQHEELLEHPYWPGLVQDPQVRSLIGFACRLNSKKVAATMNKTIFLNGLNPNINAMVKNTSPNTWQEAYNSALKIERNRLGPVDHTISLEKPSKAAASAGVNAVNTARRGGRGRGARNGSSRPDYSASNGGSSSSYARQGQSAPSAPAQRNMECWYCRKQGHAQANCRKRAARGADFVQKPKSVNEVNFDAMIYQDGSDTEQPNPDEDNDQDEFLNNALDDHIETHVDMLNINSIHLN